MPSLEPGDGFGILLIATVHLDFSIGAVPHREREFLPVSSRPVGAVHKASGPGCPAASPEAWNELEVLLISIWHRAFSPAGEIRLPPQTNGTAASDGERGVFGGGTRVAGQGTQGRRVTSGLSPIVDEDTVITAENNSI